MTSEPDEARGRAGRQPAVERAGAPGVDPDRRRPLSASYLGFVGSTGLSTLGDAAWVIALTTALTEQAGPAAAGGLLALSGLPRLVALLGGGVLADRFGPARVMVHADLLRAVVMVAAAVVVVLTGPSVVVLTVAATVLSLVGALFIPASGALRPCCCRRATWFEATPCT
ncbi:hypothetical protein SAMN05421810_10254 [Amycolatopsis arida]|uniref:Transmembrane secretion effector n=1 Tax=Amycolatopsis arida TaxID=587909 RepID=A0A1I5NW41_9PSEU|nr:hypothetical protein [Amycolatopsis arida]TDX98265.1 hypothetical protein CLV69_10154 [Amycolatopsis arida]SFP26028.1 hypothetical protein SAMN05421810_10254 [Amycolatopsis arida]